MQLSLSLTSPSTPFFISPDLTFRSSPTSPVNHRLQVKCASQSRGQSIKAMWKDTQRILDLACQFQLCTLVALHQHFLYITQPSPHQFEILSELAQYVSSPAADQNPPPLHSSAWHSSRSAPRHLSLLFYQPYFQVLPQNQR